MIPVCFSSYDHRSHTWIIGMKTSLKTRSAYMEDECCVHHMHLTVNSWYYTLSGRTDQEAT